MTDPVRGEGVLGGRILSGGEGVLGGWILVGGGGGVLVEDAVLVPQ